MARFKHVAAAMLSISFPIWPRIVVHNANLAPNCGRFHLACHSSLSGTYNCSAGIEEATIHSLSFNSYQQVCASLSTGPGSSNWQRSLALSVFSGYHRTARVRSPVRLLLALSHSFGSTARAIRFSFGAGIHSL